MGGRLFFLILSIGRLCEVNGQQWGGDGGGAGHSSPQAIMHNINQIIRQYFQLFSLPWNSIGQHHQQQQPQLPGNLIMTFDQNFGKNLSHISRLCRAKDMFCSFNPDHKMAMLELTDIFSRMGEEELMVQFSTFLKGRQDINPHVWYGAFLRAQNNFKPSMTSYQRPSSIELFPTQYFPAEIIGKLAGGQPPNGPPGQFMPPQQSTRHNPLLPPNSSPRNQFAPPNSSSRNKFAPPPPAGQFQPPRNQFQPPNSPPGQFQPPRNQFQPPNSPPGQFQPPRNQFQPPNSTPGQFQPPRNQFQPPQPQSGQFVPGPPPGGQFKQQRQPPNQPPRQLGRKKRQLGILNTGNLLQTTPQNQQSGGEPECVVLDERFGEDNGRENALWYFREDLQLNAHHFIWHLLFPTRTAQQISRRGELFVFFHHDLLARYTAERFANEMEAPTPLQISENTEIDEGYNSHLVDGLSSREWRPRPDNIQLNGNTLNQAALTRLRNLATFRERVMNILNTGNVVQTNGEPLAINDVDNIHIFGDLIEASVFSINPNFYGQPGLHNDAHWIIANLLSSGIQDGVGVMADSTVAMRDIVFYRVHQEMDNICMAYKDILVQPYGLTTGRFPLVTEGVEIERVRVQSDDQETTNLLSTFWNMRRFDIDGGLDFNSGGQGSAPLRVCAKHLDHTRFTYRIQVVNRRQQPLNAFVRIFMAPRYQPITQERVPFEEQRKLFFQLDAFYQMLPVGETTIVRLSENNTLTAPWPRSVAELRQEIQNGVRTRAHCECGFPHHMLLPRGTVQGMTFDLFVMVTEGSGDVGGGTEGGCVSSHIHCGMLGGSYPDNHPMGFPFDRRPYRLPTADGRGFVPSTLEEYIANIPNSFAIPVIIRFNDDPPQGLQDDQIE